MRREEGSWKGVFCGTWGDKGILHTRKSLIWIRTFFLFICKTFFIHPVKNGLPASCP